MKEVWKKIPGFDRYEVSNLGRVKSFAKNYGAKGKYKILKPLRVGESRKYDVIRLSNGKSYKSVNFSISRLLYQTFIGAIPLKMEIDHIDGNSLNNALSNLRLATKSQNQANKLQNRGKALPKGVSLNRTDYNVEICKDGKRQYLGRFKTIREAAQAYDEAAVKLFGKFAKRSEYTCHG